MPTFFDYPMAIQPFTPTKYNDMFIPPTELGIYDELKSSNYLPEWYKMQNDILREYLDTVLKETNPFQILLDRYEKLPVNRPFNDDGWSIETPEQPETE